MNHLQKANAILAKIDALLDAAGDGDNRHDVDVTINDYARVQAHAHVDQAESLRKIADGVDRIGARG